MIVKSVNVFREKVDIFFQYFNRNFIILRFFAEVFGFLITSTFSTVLKEKELPLYASCILL